MVLSMAGFAVEDMLIKYIALEMPTGQFLMLIGAGGALIFTLKDLCVMSWFSDFLGSGGIAWSAVLPADA